MEENVEITENQEKKKSSAKKKWLIGIAAVVTVLLLIVVLAGARMENSIRRMVSSPESYYQWVEKNMAKETASVVAELYENYLTQMEKSFDTGYKAELEVALSEVGQEVVTLLTGIAGVDVSWLESASIMVSGNVKDTAMQSLMEVALGKDTIVSLDVILDYAKEFVAYLAIPELSKQYIGLETDMDAEEVEIEQSKRLFAILQRELPDGAALEKMLQRYFFTIIEEIDAVEKAESILKVEQIAQKCTELEVTIDDDITGQVLEVLINELKEDTELKQYMIAIVDAFEAENIEGLKLGMSGEEAYEEFLAFLDDLEDKVDNFVDKMKNDDKTMVMNVFVDNQGMVIAREVELSDASSKIEAGLLIPRDGKEVAVNAYIIPKKDGEKYAIVGTGTIGGSGIAGDFAVEYNGAKLVNINVKDLDIASIRKGYLNGNFTMQMPDLIGDMIGSAYLGNTLSELRFIVDVRTEESSSDIEFSLVNGEEEWLKITTVAEFFNAKKVSLPEEKNTIAVQEVKDLEDYWNSIDWDGFIKHLEGTSLDSDIIDVFEELSKLTFEELYTYIQYLLLLE